MPKKTIANGFMTLKIELPPTNINRTIVVPQNMTLEDLHDAIQAVMGWEDAHLWSFSTGRDGVIYELPHEDDFAPFSRQRKLDASHVALTKAFPKRGAHLTYEYDFGDGWNHRITRMSDPQVAEIACIKSEGPNGFEDFGGPWRLAAFIETMRTNPNDKNYAEMRRWTGLTNAEKLERYLNGDSAEQKTVDLQEALSHVQMPVVPNAEMKPMSEDEKAHLLGLTFATVVDSDTWYVLRGAMRQGGTCKFDDPEKTIGSYLLTMFDGLKIKDGKGSVFSNTPDTLTVLPEWVAWYGKYGKDWELMRVPFDLLESYACSVANLYGAMRLDEFHEFILHYDPNYRLSQQETINFLSGRMMCPDMPFRLEGDTLISDEDFHEDDEDLFAKIEDLIDEQSHYPRWYPATRDELFKWEYFDYYEKTPATNDLVHALKTICNVPNENAYDSLVSGICHMISVGATSNICYESLVQGNFISKLSSSPRQRLISLIDQVALSVRLQFMNGNTAKEAAEQKAQTGTSDKPTVGRNDPCPCGSGKKYKKCCGRINMP